MKYIELSLKNLREESIKMANQIRLSNQIDLIVYVARAGLPIAVYMNEVFQVPLLGIGAQRKGNGLKSVVGPIISCLPRFIRYILISFELKSKIHKKDSDRNVEFHKFIKDINKNQYKNILLVDDSVDTGHSMKKCVDLITKEFPNSKIISYSLNVWTQSMELFSTDYYSYLDTIIKAPMSKDSKEYKTFCEMYENVTQNGYI